MTNFKENSLEIELLLTEKYGMEDLPEVSFSRLFRAFFYASLPHQPP